MRATSSHRTRDCELERAIAGRFSEIADNGWFPEDLPSDNAQLQKVREIVAPGPGKKILDAGCARGRFAKQLVPLGARVYGIDLTTCFVEAAHRNVPAAHFARGSVSALPFASEVFDAVYCIEVLEHLPDTRLALSEMARVLKPGGTLLVIDKSWYGLFAWNGLPNLIAKPWLERRGQWMYPPNFAFRERWFWPPVLAGQLRKYCRSVRFQYLTDGRGKASHFYRLVPFLSMDVAWVGQK